MGSRVKLVICLNVAVTGSFDKLALSKVGFNKSTHSEYLTDFPQGESAESVPLTRSVFGLV